MDPHRYWNDGLVDNPPKQFSQRNIIRPMRRVNTDYVCAYHPPAPPAIERSRAAIARLDVPSARQSRASRPSVAEGCINHRCTSAARAQASGDRLLSTQASSAAARRSRTPPCSGMRAVAKLKSTLAMSSFGISRPKVDALLANSMQIRCRSWKSMRSRTADGASWRCERIRFDASVFCFTSDADSQHATSELLNSAATPLASYFLLSSPRLFIEDRDSE